MATPVAPALVIEETWQRAMTLRSKICGELDLIQKGGPNAHETRRFEKVEDLMATYRLRCLEAIWPDIRLAAEKGYEDALWKTHTNVTKVYRKVVEQLREPDQAVVRRKVAKLYLSYLKTAQSFYKGFLQRVCARYNIRELKRIARLAEVADATMTDKSEVPKEPDEIEKIAIDSCHKILIYLGDLARYRTLARPKDRHWGNALAYYSLANELIPDSGHGHHQSGVIFSEIGNHLAVVYNFYRALVCEKPHPNALPNLEREFDKLRKGKAGMAKGSNDALISWFVKLHANYYKGEAFSSQKELESEVDTRLSMALKKDTLADEQMDLLKMVLINILAYQVGVERGRTGWTDAVARSCRFILLQNIKTIHILSRLLREELIEIVQRKPVEVPGNNADSASRKDMGKFTSTFNRVLPMLRVYMTWLCYYSADLAGYKDHLEPHFGQMCKTLAHTLNLLFDLLSSDPASVQTRLSCRFPEDDETLGMDCLNGPKLHDGCQLHYDPILRKPKPRAEDVKDAGFTVDAMTSTRALDVISCALDLANHSLFPIAHSKTVEGGQVDARFVYTEGGKPIPSHRQIAPPTPSVDAIPTTTAPPVVQNAIKQLPTRAAPIDDVTNDSDEFSEDQEFYSAPVKSAKGLRGFMPAERAISRPQLPPPSEFSLDNQLFHILNDFLIPPETGRKAQTPQAQTPRQNEGSYGTGSTTSAEILGPVAPASPNPGSATTRAFPTLPWNYFYNPAPVEGNAHNPAAAPAAGNSPRWEQAYGSVRSRPSTSGNGIPAQDSARNTNTSVLAGGVQAQKRYSGTLPTIGAGFHALEAPQPTAFSGTDVKDYGKQPSPGHEVRGAWAGAEGTMGQPGVFPSSAQASPWSSPAGRWDLGQHAPGGHTAPQSSFSATQFSGVNSSLPPVNSPRGVPMKTQQAGASGAVSQPSSAWLNPIQSPSAFVSSTSTTPLAATSGAGGANGSNQPRPHSNGRAADATAAYDYKANITIRSSPARVAKAGSADMSKYSTVQMQKQQQSIAAIRAPYGPWAHGRTNFGNHPKR